MAAGNWGCCWGHQTGGGEVTCDSIGGGGTGGNVYNIIIIIIMVLEGVILIVIILARYVHHGHAGMDREYSLIRSNSDFKSRLMFHMISIFNTYKN